VIVATQVSTVYVLRSGNSSLFKIGRTRNLGRRMEQLASGNPDRLTLFDSIETDDAAACETYLHHRLRSRRSKDSDATEFFDLDPEELRDVIQDARAFLDDFIPKQREAERLANEESREEILLPEMSNGASTAPCSRFAKPKTCSISIGDNSRRN
jgi:Meiotically up-regulated gene 113